MVQETQAFKAAAGPESMPGRKWFKGTLHPELLEKAPRRLGLLAVASSVVLLCGFLFFFEAEESFIRGFDSRIVSIMAVVFSLAISAVVFFITRIKTIRITTIARVGLAWEILFALGIAVAQRMESWEAYMEFRGFSAVAILIVVYAVIIPATSMSWIALSAVLAAAMDPAGLMINVALGKAMPPLHVLVSMFVPTVLAVLIAVFCASVVFRLGQAVQRAKQMGSYQLVEQMGKGGMGEVWQAKHSMLARPAAIKLIRPEVFASQKGVDARQVLKRFKQEAQATALLDSEHTIHLYDFGATEDGSLFYVMELLDGMDLEDLVKSTGPVSPERAVFFLEQACDSLTEAHSRGLVHCDIKPANLFVCRRGRKLDFIKVLYFGLVKKAADIPFMESTLGIQEKLVGTPAYLSPEMIMGEGKPDARTDIYALGCVAYWLLSGKLVFEREDGVKMMLDHVQTDPPLLSSRTDRDIPGKLESIVHACLQKKPDKRPQTMDELSSLLAEVPVDRAWDAERAWQWWNQHFPDKSSTMP